MAAATVNRLRQPDAFGNADLVLGTIVFVMPASPAGRGQSCRSDRRRQRHGPRQLG
jgi:hypothetical protein